MNSEPARRFRAELLARLDGLLSTENVNVTLLAATNVPWYALEKNNIKKKRYEQMIMKVN